MTDLELKIMELLDYGQISVLYHRKLWLITCAHQFQGLGKTLIDAVDNCLEEIKRSTQ